MQAGTRGEHPAGEDAFDLALQRHFIDFDEGIRVGGLGRRPRVAHARGDLQRAELHRFSDRRVERDDATRDFVEPGKHRTAVRNLLRRHFGDNGVVGLRRGVRRLRRRRIGRLHRRSGRLRRNTRALGGRWRRSRAGRRRQGLRLNVGGLALDGRRRELRLPRPPHRWRLGRKTIRNFRRRTRRVAEDIARLRLQRSGCKRPAKHGQ